MTPSFISLRIGGGNTLISCYAGRLLIVLLCSGLMLSGCAVDLPFLKDKRVNQEVASKAVTEKTAKKVEKKTEPLVYYVGVEDLRLYKEPGASGNWIAVLGRYQKVFRYKIEKGFSRVKVDGTDMTGWVETTKLIQHLPNPSVGEPVGYSPETSSSPSDETPEMGTREGETKPTASPEPTPRSVDPSAFDAF